MTDITVEELKQKYPVQKLSLYGECIIVPGAEFDPDWEALLADKGYHCFITDLDATPVTLVQLKKTVSEPTATLRDKMLAARWQPEEDAFLMDLYNSGTKYTDIFRKLQARFPTRTLPAMTNRIGALQGEGKIKRRKGGRPAGRKKLRKELEAVLPRGTKSVHKAVRNAPPEPTCTGPEPIQSEVTSLLKQILAELKNGQNPLESLMHFEAYCPSCRDFRTVEDSNVWKTCPVCGGPLIIWDVGAIEAPT